MTNCENYLYLMEKAMASASQRMRETGNVLYKQLAAGPCKFAKPVRRMKLTQAEQHYKSALAASQSPADRAACLKNLGMLHFLWSKFEVNDAVDDLEEGQRTGPGQSSSGPQLAYAKTKVAPAVEYLLKAIREGKSAGNSEEWLEGLDTVLLKMVEWADDHTRALQLPHAPLLRCLCEGFNIALTRNPRNRHENSPAAAVIAYHRLAERLFNQGVLHLVGDDEDSRELGLEPHRDYKACLSFLHDASQFLRQAQTLRVAEAELALEVTELQERVETQIFVCESTQAREMGDEALRAALHGDVQISMELTLQAIDWYRQATVLTRDRDIEGEAIAMSRLGKVYSEVLKDDARASKAHYQATKLALTIMSPRIGRSRCVKNYCLLTNSLEFVGRERGIRICFMMVESTFSLEYGGQLAYMETNPDRYTSIF